MSVTIRILCSFSLLLLISCATTDSSNSSVYGDQRAYQNSSSTANYKYDVWRLNEGVDLEVINGLLDEADVLINEKKFNAATDKLERVLRIKPAYAPAWSRLSWLALQTNSAQRSVQLAKRSNSFAYDNPELQILNWTFIRTASQMLHDEESFERAVLKIESLKAF